MNTIESIESMNEYEIIYNMIIFYIGLLLLMCGLYLRSMYVQYKNAHDKWYDINRD